MKILFSIILLQISAVCFAQKNCKTNLDSLYFPKQSDLIGFADSLAIQNLKVKNRSKDIPHFIKKAIKCQGGEFRIADVGKPFNPTDVIWDNTPRRRIRFLGVSENYLILAFEQGGIVKSNHIMIFKYKKKTIEKFWNGYDRIYDDITSENVMMHIYESIKYK